MPVDEQSNEKKIPAVRGQHTAGGVGVVGSSENYRGVEGRSTNEHAVFGRSTKGAGVAGISEDNRGVIGRSTNEHGVLGQSTKGAGIVGLSDEYRGVIGQSKKSSGVVGESEAWVGVYGETSASAEAGSCGVLGDGKSGGVGVKGHARGAGMAGVAGYQLDRKGPGVYGEGAPAGYFAGDVIVTGDLVLQGADYAEALPVADTVVEAGMVVVLDGWGRITPCLEDYDARVAGIVSGAGGVRPGIVLDRHDGGAPVALAGKLWVLADATDAPIRCGDLLTTSSTRGHARRVTDRDRALGAIIGKALTNLPAGCGMVRALVAPV